MGCNRVFDRVLSGQPSHTGLFFPLFFLQLNPVPTARRPSPGLTCLVRPGFKTMHFTVKLVEQAKKILLTAQHFTNKKLMTDQFISFKI